jgi:cholest-4-en-3-one 26-monooxygenase
MDLSDIDLLDRDTFTKGVPHEWLTYLRNNHPVYRHPEPNGPGFWVITKYDDVVTVGRDAATFSSDQKRGGVVGLEDNFGAGNGETDDRREFEDAYGDAKLMLMTDPPEHTRQRKLVNKGFTPRMVGALETHIRELTTGIIDEVIESGRADFVVDIAAELPLQVIAEMLGVPHEDRLKLFDWTNRMVGSEDPEYEVEAGQVVEAQAEMFMYAQALADDRRANPRKDIVTTLLEAELDGDRLSEMDFNLFFMLLSVAGNETTRNSMAHGMLAFFRNPDQWAKLVEDPKGRSSLATEEIVRWASPVMYFRRNVTKDTVIRGQELKAGEKVAIYYCSANRDEDVFDRPFEFDISRDPNPHIGFGGGGPHFCLGANLARLEIWVLFEELARRMPDIELVGEPDYLRSNFIGGIKHMPVVFTPGAKEAAK